jgi:hypothetical protein
VRKVITGVVASTALFAAALVAPAAQASTCEETLTEQAFLDWHDSASYFLVDGGDFETAAPGWQLDGGAATASGGNTLRPQSSATSLSLPAGSSATTPPTCVSKGDPYMRLFTQSAAAGELKTRIKVDVLYLNDDATVRKVKKAGKVSPQTFWRPTRRLALAQGQLQRKANTDHGQAGEEHGQAGENHGQAGEHGQGAEHGQAGDDHGQSGEAHGQAGEHGQSGGEHGQSGGEHGQSGGDQGGGAVKTTHIALRFTALGSDSVIDDVFVDPRMRR